MDFCKLVDEPVLSSGGISTSGGRPAISGSRAACGVGISGPTGRADIFQNVPLPLHTPLGGRNVPAGLHPFPDLTQIRREQVGRRCNAAGCLVLHGELEVGICPGQDDQVAPNVSPSERARPAS